MLAMIPFGPPRLRAESTAVDPNQLVLQAVHRSVWGPSLTCRVRQESVWDDHTVTGVGQYWQIGGGTGQFKLALSLSTEHQQASFLQVSDGRLVWTSLGEHESPRRVYLDRVRQALGGMVSRPREHPEASLYLAIGGQAEALRCLYHRYRWFKAFAGIDDAGRPVWQLVGTLRTEMPRPAALTKVDQSLVAANPPREVPTDVRVTLGRDEERFLFPYRIDYFRRELVEEGLPERLIRVSTIAYDEITSPIEIQREFFAFRGHDQADKITDETNDYMPLQPQAQTSPLLQR